MKIIVEFTPEEARTFLGLPDVKPMQDALLAEMQEHLSQNLQAMNPTELFKTWMPVGLENMKQWQEIFFSQNSGKK